MGGQQRQRDGTGAGGGGEEGNGDESMDMRKGVLWRCGDNT